MNKKFEVDKKDKWFGEWVEYKNEEERRSGNCSSVFLKKG